ncbi:MAG TPA: hypothetical protein EYG74_06520 [Sulfurimonas autotrophica]|nr:hypothetical protein [Sulfurimonas autotrophica]
MSTEQPSLDEIKTSLDIVTIAELYGELKKVGANYSYKDDKSIIINPSKQIFSNFNGDIMSGSVLDLIMYMEKIELNDAIKKLKELAGAETYTIDPAKQLQRKTEASKKKVVDFQKLGLFAKNDLTAGQAKKPIPITIEGDTILNYLSINEVYHKLFERTQFTMEYHDKINYLYNHIIGYDEYFKCASIIIRDSTGRVVDKCAYRPKKPDSYDNWGDPKYIHKNSHTRGNDFLYPFQKEVESILAKEDYFIVGEGIKNAVNALIYGVPYITIESTSNKANHNLIEYIKALLNNQYKVIAMFDGDKAGAIGYKALKKELGTELDNFFDFTSDEDFTSYIVGENA